MGRAFEPGAVGVSGLTRAAGDSSSRLLARAASRRFLDHSRAPPGRVGTKEDGRT
eukprot:COSAG06_NODE_274_length_18646_cov_21.468539_6_plen_55_part_00